MRLLHFVVAAFALTAPVALGVAPAPAPAATSPHSLPGFTYVSPAPGSQLHRPETNIIVRPGGVIDLSSLTEDRITATGSLTGEHPGTLRLSDDGETILFRPVMPFWHEEAVTCSIAAGIRTAAGDTLDGASFTFHIGPSLDAAALDPGSGLADRIGWSMEPDAMRSPSWSPATSLDSVPGLPDYQLSVTGPTAPGHLFVSDFRFDDPSYRSHLMILRNDGTPVFQKYLGEQGLDFKVQLHRWLTYFDGARGTYYVQNANGAVVDSIQTGNGYPIDLHELILLPNGHSLLMSYDRQPVDMSAVVEGGNPDAIVVGLVLQELDLEKDVVFQWRSWDHFQITDATSRSLTTATVDYAHGNSIEPDHDGNLIFSSRHMDEVTKVSRETGAILWRLGGKNNQFTFVNDPDRFAWQHSARRLANGNLLLYDNGNTHTPSYSRAVEYALDEANRTATLVWQYRNTPDTFGGAMGSVQRLPNGNTLIGWGSTNPTATEVTADGRKVAELNLPTGTFSYRAFRFEWPPTLSIAPRVDSDAIDVGRKGQHLSFRFSSDEFSVFEVDFATLRLAGALSPVEIRVGDPVPAGAWSRSGHRLAATLASSEAKVTFSVESLLPYLKSGSQQLSLTGKLRSGEAITGSVTVKVSGERSARARVLSPVGAFPIQLAVRATGVPRSVTFEAHDVHGRRVARWTATSDAAGHVTWDGRASDGQRLRSGIYFVGTEGSVLAERAKVAVVK
ncbi:MAG TPA: aryl-sulfate sulfotransferase [Candidatus Eisenbacteria bacterium]|nr:aryl-sulfate sulfotransferase [Candidatus Eisenbacteria bacterium]